jgi:hypothetical protein
MKQRLSACFRALFSVAVLAGLLSACVDERAVMLGPQQWQDLGVKVETRPSPLRVGMNEFIVIASRDEYKPGVGLIVMLRVNENGKWRQAIQDGFTGVYRRAVQVDDPATQSLSVHIRRSKSKDETTLLFPLNQQPEGLR